MIPATSFYLLRHGESEANVARVAAGGGVDSPLTELGRRQARDLANIIHHLEEKPSAVFCSPMSRARETAEIVNTKLNLSFSIIPNLEEHRFGEWEGMSWDIMKPKVFAGEQPPNGESYDAFAARVGNALRPILEQKHDAPPLIVAHGGTFYSILRLFGLPKPEGVKNCHLHRFDPFPANADIPWKIWQYNAYKQGFRRCDAVFCPQITAGK